MEARFDGCIAGLGTSTGLRVVVGSWRSSPFGAFADVMVERSDGYRLLLAPTDEVLEFVRCTYRFDEARVVEVEVTVTLVEDVEPGLPDAPTRQGVDAEGDPAAGPTRWRVAASPLELVFYVAGRPALGHLLRAVPRPLATWRPWIALTDAVASRMTPGVRTRGSAGGGCEAFYAALDLHRIAAATVTWEGADQGHLTEVQPPVRFGFGSTPREPSVTRIVTIIRG